MLVADSLGRFAAGDGQYASWYADQPRRAKFYEQAIRLMKRYTRKSFSSGILLSDFRAWLNRYVIPEYLRYPFVLCSLSVIRQYGLWANQNNVNDELAVFFEDGDKHKGKLYEALCLHGLEYVKPNFRDARTVSTGRYPRMGTRETREGCANENRPPCTRVYASVGEDASDPLMAIPDPPHA